jgi:hypothetical protein
MGSATCCPTDRVEFSSTTAPRLYLIRRKSKRFLALFLLARIFQYIERRASDRTDILTAYKLSSYPKALHKKVTLLQHFRSYLEGVRTQSTQFAVENCFLFLFLGRSQASAKPYKRGVSSILKEVDED